MLKQAGCTTASTEGLARRSGRKVAEQALQIAGNVTRPFRSTEGRQRVRPAQSPCSLGPGLLEKSTLGALSQLREYRIAVAALVLR
jgi:hypothetical protein